MVINLLKEKLKMNDKKILKEIKSTLFLGIIGALIVFGIATLMKLFLVYYNTSKIFIFFLLLAMVLVFYYFLKNIYEILKDFKEL